MEKINQLLFSHLWLFLLIIIWSIFWKGLALWKSARLGQYIWFVLMLVINTIGILEIIYIFFVAPIKLRANMRELNDTDSSQRKII